MNMLSRDIRHMARAFPRSDVGWDPLTGSRSGRGVLWEPRPRLKKRVEECGVRIGTWNVGSMTGRGREIAEVMDRRRVDVLCVQETRWTGNNARDLGGDCKILYSGARGNRNGVGIIVRGHWRDKVLEVKRINDRLMSVKMLMKTRTLNVISGYAPQVGCSDEEKEEFRNNLEEVIREIPEAEALVVGADLNGRVGETSGGYEQVHGGKGFGVRNEEGERMLEMAESLELVFLNTYFRKPEEHLITYKSGGRISQIDYILVRKGDRRVINNCKVVPGEHCVTQHRLLLADCKWKAGGNKGYVKNRKLKLWELKGGKLQEFREEVHQKRNAVGRSDTVNEVWTDMKRALVGTAEEVVGRTKGGGNRRENEWWWSEGIREVLQRKKMAFREWKTNNSEDAREHYRRINREAKTVVREAKERASRDLYESLNTREGEKKIFRIARARQKKRQDLGTVGVVKDENGRVLQTETDVKVRWNNYFEQLLNVEYGREELEEIPCIEGPINMVSRSEVEGALRKMKNGKTPGPSEVSIELINALGDEGKEWLVGLLQRVVRDVEIPDDWRRSRICTLYKNKGDILECGNFRGLKMTEHLLKVMERIVDDWLRGIVQIRSIHFGYMKGRGTMDAIFIVRQLQEKALEGNQKVYYGFVDLEKAYDRVPREVVFWCLRRRGVPERLIDIVKEMYRRSRTVVSTVYGDTEEFGIEVGLHQGSALSPFLFVVVLDVLSEEVGTEDIWELLYADDLVVMANSKEDLQQRIVEWQRCLERGGLRVNAGKTETMVSSREEGEQFVLEDIHGRQLKQVSNFKYLGATVESTGGTEQEVRNRISAGWARWREVSSVIYDRKMPLRLRVKIYTAVVRPVMLYGAETWALRKSEEKQLERTEMRMLRWLMRISLRERRRNEDIRAEAGVVAISEKVREARLRWFGHVVRMEEDNPVKMAWRRQVEGRRSRGRQRFRWRDGVERDLRQLNLREEDAEDRRYWRQRIRAADPTRD